MGVYAYSAEQMIDGMIISTRAMTGTPPEVTVSAPSGRIRSKAAAKIIRVDDKKTVPYQPKSNREMAAMRTIWKAWLGTIQEIIAVGEMESPPNGDTPHQKALIVPMKV